jgi:hypothetical protein
VVLTILTSLAIQPHIHTTMCFPNPEPKEIAPPATAALANTFFQDGFMMLPSLGILRTSSHLIQLHLIRISTSLGKVGLLRLLARRVVFFNPRLPCCECSGLCPWPLEYAEQHMCHAKCCSRGRGSTCPLAARMVNFTG